jgi:hypothetical protein
MSAAAANVKAADGVQSVHPPVGVMRWIVNPIVRTVVGTPIGRRVSGIVVLRFDGRLSGRHYAIPAVVHPIDGQMVVFSDARWVANFRGGWALDVRHNGTRYSTTAQLVEDGPSTAALLRRVLEAKKPRALGLSIDDGYVPTDEELSNARRAIVLELLA